MYSDILAQVRTTQEAEELEGKIDSLMDSAYLKGKERGQVPQLISEQYRQAKDKEEFLKGLLKALSAVKEIVLTLAMEATEEQKEGISRWLKENIGPEVVFEVEVDSSVIGGAKVMYKGNYRDFSLKKKLGKIDFGQELQQSE